MHLGRKGVWCHASLRFQEVADFRRFRCLVVDGDGVASTADPADTNTTTGCGARGNSVVSGAVAGVAVGSRPQADGGRTHQDGPGGRIQLEPARTFRGALRPRLAGSSDYRGGETSHRDSCWNSHGNTASVAHGEVSRDFADRAERATGDARKSRPRLSRVRLVSGFLLQDRGRDGKTIWPQSQRGRMADRQRIW